MQTATEAAAAVGYIVDLLSLDLKFSNQSSKRSLTVANDAKTEAGIMIVPLTKVGPAAHSVQKNQHVHPHIAHTKSSNRNSVK